jgi:hypothetical protein
MAHSVAAKFVTINPIAEDVDGKKEPQVILIPTDAWMTWTMHKVGNDAKTMTEHYKDK